MKDYKEIADNVLRRSEEILANKRRRRRIGTRVSALAVCFCLTALIGLGVWQIGSPPMNLNTHVSQQDPSASAATETPDEIGSQSNRSEEPGEVNSNFTASIPEDLPILSSYGENMAAASYATPKNGACGFSIPLRGAIDEYGDQVLYKAIVHVFADQQALEPYSQEARKEINRLLAYGYTVHLEKTSLVLYATQAQLANFPANESYGYFFFLYGER